MDVLLGRVTLILAVAAGGEGIIEFLASPLLDLWIPDRESKLRVVVFNLLSALLGLGLAFGFNLGIVALLGGEDVFGWGDRAFTGLLLGRGSNWLHIFFKRFLVNLRESLQNIEMMKKLE